MSVRSHINTPRLASLRTRQIDPFPPSSSRLRACEVIAAYFALIRLTEFLLRLLALVKVRSRQRPPSPSPHAPFLNISRAYSTSSRTHSVHVIHPNRVHLSSEWCLGTRHLVLIRMHPYLSQCQGHISLGLLHLTHHLIVMNVLTLKVVRIGEEEYLSYMRGFRL